MSCWTRATQHGYVHEFAGISHCPPEFALCGSTSSKHVLIFCRTSHMCRVCFCESYCKSKGSWCVSTETSLRRYEVFTELGEAVWKRSHRLYTFAAARDVLPSACSDTMVTRCWNFRSKFDRLSVDSTVPERAVLQFQEMEMVQTIDVRPNPATLGDQDFSTRLPLIFRTSHSPSYPVQA